MPKVGKDRRQKTVDRIQNEEQENRCDRQRRTGNRRPATCNAQLETDADGGPPTADNRRLATDDGRRTMDNGHRITDHE